MTRERIILQRLAQKAGHSPAKNKQTNKTQQTYRRNAEGKNHGNHKIAPPPGKWARVSEQTPGRTMQKQMQLVIKGDKDPGNRPRGPSEPQECLLCFIPRELRELCWVCERRDEAFLFLIPHHFPEPRDRSTTTDDSLFFLSIYPPVPLATSPVVCARLPHRGIYLHLLLFYYVLSFQWSSFYKGVC